MADFLFHKNFPWICYFSLISRLLFSMSYQNISNRFHPLRKLALLCNMILEGISIFTTNLPSLSLSAKLNISSASSGSTGVGRSCNYCTKIDYIITVGVILLWLFDPSYSFGDFHACAKNSHFSICSSEMIARIEKFWKYDPPGFWGPLRFMGSKKNFLGPPKTQKNSFLKKPEFCDLSQLLWSKTSQNGLKVAKAGHKSEGHEGW